MRDWIDPSLLDTGRLCVANSGKRERSIMKQTGHRSMTVVRRYIRDTELFDHDAAAGIGL